MAQSLEAVRRPWRLARSSRLGLDTWEMRDGPRRLYCREISEWMRGRCLLQPSRYRSGESVDKTNRIRRGSQVDVRYRSSTPIQFWEPHCSRRVEPFPMLARAGSKRDRGC